MPLIVKISGGRVVAYPKLPAIRRSGREKRASGARAAGHRRGLGHVPHIGRPNRHQPPGFAPAAGHTATGAGCRMLLIACSPGLADGGRRNVVVGPGMPANTGCP